MLFVSMQYLGGGAVLRKFHSPFHLLYVQSPGYGAAILVVRNPFDALIAEWNREKSNYHTGVASPEIFGE